MTRRSFYIISVFITLLMFVLQPKVSTFARASFAYGSNVQHSGELVVQGQEILIINDTNFVQLGNVTVKDNGSLIIANSRFSMSAYIWTYMKTKDNGSLTVLDSELTSQTNVLSIHSYDNSRMIFQRVFFSFYASTVIDLSNNSTATITDSRQNGSIQLEPYDNTTLEVENSSIGMLLSSGQPTISFSNVNMTSGSNCKGQTNLTMNHAHLQEWLSMEESSSLVCEDSTLDMLWSYGTSNLVISDSYVKWIQPSEFSSLKISGCNSLWISAPDSTNLTIDSCDASLEISGSSRTQLSNSTVTHFNIALPDGFTSRISGLRNGYLENYAFYINEEVLTFNISKCSVESFELVSRSLILEDSKISELTVPSYGAVVILNSDILDMNCHSHSYTILWNSRAAKINADPLATIRYASTVSSDLLYITIGVSIILASVLSTAIVMSRRNRRYQIKNLKPEDRVKDTTDTVSANGLARIGGSLARAKRH